MLCVVNDSKQKWQYFHHSSCQELLCGDGVLFLAASLLCESKEVKICECVHLVIGSVEQVLEVVWWSWSVWIRTVTAKGKCPTAPPHVRLFNSSSKVKLFFLTRLKCLFVY